ncbi:hypothetical protein, partial [Inquilinus sp. CA228]|uniref:hypothetical protein n=1 Tax=Inquilinus sp. CA228 TaxID=3455609 RepID=UPI003F8D3AB2
STSFGTSVTYNTELRYAVDTSLSLAVSTTASYTHYSGWTINQYGAGQDTSNLNGEGDINLGAGGSFNALGQTFFTPGTVVIGSRPATGTPIVAENIAALGVTSKVTKLTALAGSLTATLDTLGPAYIDNVPPAFFSTTAAVVSRAAAPAAATAAAIVAATVAGTYKKIERPALMASIVEPTITIGPLGITLRVGTSAIEITEAGISISAPIVAIKDTTLANRIEVSAMDITANALRTYILSPTEIIGPTSVTGSAMVQGPFTAYTVAAGIGKTASLSADPSMENYVPPPLSAYREPPMGPRR